MIDLESTIRTATAAATLSRITPLAWEKFGITRVANITGLDKISIPVYVSIRPNSKSLSVSQGKGVTEELAKISALMESIETWHAENIEPDKIILTGTYQKLKKDHPVVNPDLFLDAEAASLANTKLEWIVGTELIHNKKVYLPLKLYSLDMTKVDSITQQFAPSSNGLASGNTYDEAVCHSLCELIERDAVARWMQLSEVEQDRQLLDLDSLTDPTIKLLLNKIRAADLNLYIWDISNEFGIPAYYCALTDSIKQPFTLFTSSGAHFTNKVALLRAITEVAQARLTYISGSRDDVFPDFYQTFNPSEIVAELKNSNAQACYTAHELPTFTSFSAVNDYLLNTLAQHQIANIYLMDHTRPSLDLAVVHTLSPHLLNGGG